MSGPPKSKPLTDRSLAARDQEGFQTELEGSRRGANGTAEGRSLGIYAETYSTPTTARVVEEGAFRGLQSIDPETGECARFELVEGKLVSFDRDSRTARAERYALKAAARRLLPKDHRTTKCMHWRLPDHDIQVLKGATTDKAFFNGLQVCAMPWTCPVCATKISERRRQEVAKAVKQAEALGLQVFLLTLTVPHGLGDDVNEILDKMMAAWKRLWQGRQGMELRNALGLFGHIRALEVTHGENGFHPHFHALLFFHPQQTTPAGWGMLLPRWQSVAVRSGLPRPSDSHGCRIDDGKKAARYVSKGVWGLESEVTKGHVKTGKKGSRTPFDLLKAFMHGDKASGALWRVYVDAFTGRRQLYWSNGLKKLLAIADLSDEEIANKPEDEQALLLASITDEQWRIIFKRKQESAVLDLAEISGDVLRLFLEQLVPDRATSAYPALV